ncbi:MAG: PAS domain S-box protein [Deltaproteobacteria bacterium]|nr:PAS domain S-box protein [Deltaproteobacteria bacterium]
MDEKAKILIVDDERIIAREMQYKLESMGYDVPAIVSSGEEAIKKVQELQPDLVLMDIILQGEIDGVEAADQIRIRFGTPVVYVTANVSNARLEDITRSEPFGCLFKPFEDMELRAAVKMALYKYRMEKKLRESEEEFRILAETTPVAVMVYQDNKWMYANSAACKICGYSEEEILSMNYWNFVHPDYQELIKKRGRQRQEGTLDIQRYEFKIITKGGEERWIDLSGGALAKYKNKPAGIISVIDITEQKQTEEALRNSEKKYRTLDETTKDATFVLDLDGKFTYISPVAEELTGYSWQDFLGRPFTEFIAPEYMESTVERFKKGLAGKDISLYKIEVKHKDGGTVPAELNVSSLLDATGKITGRTGVARDITERKQAEEKIKTHQEHIALINQILCHDITNDLVVIQSAINLYNKSPEEELLQEISSHAEKSLELINRMRGLESFMSRHRELQICEMRGTIDEVIKNYPFIDFKVKGKAYAMADDSLVSVIDNIIRNAVIHGKADRITIAAGKKRDMCEVRIADNGTGIPDEIKERIFEEGFTHGVTSHTGLGLHIVKKAMESYGGYAFVEDNEPKGAVFILRFRGVK